MKIRDAFARLLIVLFFLTAFRQSAVACPQDIARTTDAFIRLYVAGDLTVNAAKKLLGDKSLVERHSSYWRIQSDRKLMEMVLHAESQDKPVEDADLRLKLESGLVLNDLEKSLGHWQLVFASKTSSVSFRVGGRGGKSAIVFARLFTPKPLPESPVTSVLLRRDEGKQGQGAR